MRAGVCSRIEFFDRFRGPMNLLYRMPRALVVAAILSFWTMAAAAQFYIEPATRVGRPYLEAGLGVFEPQSTNHLANQDGQGFGAVGGGYRVSPGFAWGVEISGFQQRVDTPEGVSNGSFRRIDTRSRLSVEGLDVNARYIVPFDRWEPYVGGGLGWYRSLLEVRGTSFFFRDTVAEEKSNDFGAHVLAGVDYWIRPRIALGAEVRFLRLNARFDSLLQGTEHVGGTSVMLRYRQAF
jgi:opacity protein-like surface antigen